MYELFKQIVDKSLNNKLSQLQIFPGKERRIKIRSRKFMCVKNKFEKKKFQKNKTTQYPGYQVLII